MKEVDKTENFALAIAMNRLHGKSNTGEGGESDVDRLSGLLRRIRSGMTVTVRYFQEDTVHPASPPLGIFCELTGRVERIDPVFQTLHLSDGTVRTDIRFEDLDDIDIL